MIRVAANLSWLIPGVVGGSEEYTVRLVRAVIESSPSDLELRLVGSTELRAAYPDLTAVPFDVVPGPLHLRPFRVGAESTRVHSLTRGADLVHHFGGRLPARRHGNDAVTIHDLQPIHRPGNFSPAKRRYLARALPLTAAGATLICTPSQWVADAVVAEFDSDRLRVRAVPSTYATAHDLDTGFADTFADRPVVLYPAMTHPHKNHEVLIEAVEKLTRRLPDIVLVLTGAAGRAEDRVAELVAASPATVVRPGRVSAGELAALLERATVLAFPSRYEGFGLPVLEAMHVGTAVVAADSAALPEVVGDAARLVDPDDIDGWVDALEVALTDAEERERLAVAGRARATYYAPGAAARRLMDAWRSVT